MERRTGWFLYSSFHSFIHSVNSLSDSWVSFHTHLLTEQEQRRHQKMLGLFGPEELVRWIMLFNKNIIIFPLWICSVSGSWPESRDQNGKWWVLNHQFYLQIKKPSMRSWKQKSRYLWCMDDSFFFFFFFLKSHFFMVTWDNGNEAFIPHLAHLFLHLHHYVHFHKLYTGCL